MAENVTTRWYGHEWDEAIGAAIRTALVATASEIVMKAIELAPVGVTSHLRGSIGMGEAVITDVDQHIDLGYTGTGGAGHYGKYVEFGTKPHFPPPKALELWCQRVLGADDPERAAYLVARAISQRGTKAQPHLRPAFAEHAGKLPDRIKVLIQRELDNRIPKH